MIRQVGWAVFLVVWVGLGAGAMWAVMQAVAE